MDFKSLLQKIVENVDGAMGASVIGEDGIAIDQFSAKSDFDITAARAEYSTIISSAKKSFAELRPGQDKRSFNID